MKNLNYLVLFCCSIMWQSIASQDPAAAARAEKDRIERERLYEWNRQREEQARQEKERQRAEDERRRQDAERRLADLSRKWWQIGIQ